jgi:hypothetical protein
MHVFYMDLPHSDAPFMKSYPAEMTESFLDGHVSAFAFFGKVPLSILYDNTKIAVAKICGDGKRERTRAFTELVSHYLFRDRFGRPGKGNDKGKVESLVKNGRRTFLTPVPQAASYKALNARLAADCRARQAETAGRHREPIGTRLVADLAAFRDLPATALEPCDKRTARVSSTALVRYRDTDYSVPTMYGFREVLVKGFVDTVVILAGAVRLEQPSRAVHLRAAFASCRYLRIRFIETTSAASPRMVAAMALAIWLAAAFSGSLARCAYRMVVCACEWPSNPPIMFNDIPLAAPTLANE